MVQMGLKPPSIVLLGSRFYVLRTFSFGLQFAVEQLKTKKRTHEGFKIAKTTQGLVNFKYYLFLFSAFIITIFLVIKRTV